MDKRIGLIGGTGMLGGEIGRRWLDSGLIAASQLWISNQSGKASGYDAWPDVTFTADSQALVDACAVVVLCVPPAHFDALTIKARSSLVVSVMAGVTIADIRAATDAQRIVRAMSSPAAGRGLAFSPWCPGPELSEDDRETVATLLQALGETACVPTEDQIDHFTALTGPVPGFVAAVAAAMEEHMVAVGVDKAIAKKAVAQLILSSGVLLSNETRPAKDCVDDMIAYAGTTAVGLVAMQEAGLEAAISLGLQKAYERTKTIRNG